MSTLVWAMRDANTAIALCDGDGIVIAESSMAVAFFAPSPFSFSNPASRPLGCGYRREVAAALVAAANRDDSSSSFNASTIGETAVSSLRADTRSFAASCHSIN